MARRANLFDPRAFVVCNATDASDGSRSQSPLGYSKARERYTDQTYSTSGNSRYEWGFSHADKGITFTDGRPAAAGTTRVQVWLEPQAHGRLRFRQERSVNGGRREHVAAFFYVRVPRAAQLFADGGRRTFEPRHGSRAWLKPGGRHLMSNWRHLWELLLSSGL